MTLYDITLNGCDDATYLVDVDLAEVEHAALVRVAALADVDGGGCKPTLRVVEAPLAPADNELCHDCWGRIAPAPATRRRGEWVHKTCPDPTTTDAGFWHKDCADAARAAADDATCEGGC